jgi:hypothetical protein
MYARVQPNFASLPCTNIGGCGRSQSSFHTSRVEKAVTAERRLGRLPGCDQTRQWLEVPPPPHRPRGSNGVSTGPPNTGQTVVKW